MVAKDDVFSYKMYGRYLEPQNPQNSQGRWYPLPSFETTGNKSENGWLDS